MATRVSDVLAVDEIDDLEAAKRANPHYFRSLMRGVNVMADRVRKYSGDEEPYLNFIIYSRAKGIKVDNCFVDYELIKWARNWVDTGDFNDESAVDSEVDMGNYANIGGGWRSRPPIDRVKAELACGSWVNIHDMIDAGLVDREVIASLE